MKYVIAIWIVFFVLYHYNETTRLEKEVKLAKAQMVNVSVQNTFCQFELKKLKGEQK